MAQDKIYNRDINAAAAIARSKLAAGTANRVVVNDGSGVLSDLSAGTSGQVLTSNGASAPAWSTLTNTYLVAGMQSAATTATNAYYMDPSTITVAPATPATSIMRGRPIVFGRAHSINGLFVNVTAGAAVGRLARVWLYEVDSDGWPSTLVGDSGDIDCSATGIRGNTGLSIAVVGSKGYWFGSFTNGTTSFSGFGTGLPIALTSAVAALNCISVAQAFGAPPASFPAGPALNVTSSFAMPFMRFA